MPALSATVAAGVVHTTNPDETGIDIYIGIGGAPGRRSGSSSPALRSGQMIRVAPAQYRRKIARAAGMGIMNPREGLYDGRKLTGRRH